jgi:lysophospholipase L1-like esterase
MKRKPTGIIVCLFVCMLAAMLAGCSQGEASPLMTTSWPEFTLSSSDGPVQTTDPESGNSGNQDTEADDTATEDTSSDGTPDRVLFIGDSITEGLQIYNTLPGAMIQAYRGLSSYKLAEELTLIEAKKPDRIFLLIGLNDIMGIEENEPFFENYRAFIRAVHDILPETKVFVQSIFPISREVEQENHNISRVLIDSFNRRLAVMAEEEKATYIDVATTFKDEEGYLLAEFTSDGIHLWSYYYRAWTDLLRPYLGSFPYPEATGENNEANETAGTAETSGAVVTGNPDTESVPVP